MQRVKQLGFRYADIGATGLTSQVNQLQAAREPARVGAELRALAKSHHIELVELFACSMWIEGAAIDTNHPDAAVRKQILAQFRKLCQCAPEAGFHSVMGVPGRPQSKLSAEAALYRRHLCGVYGAEDRVRPGSASSVS